MVLIYEDLTRELIGRFFDVHNSLGVGYDEPAYHKAVQRRFYKKGIEHRSEERKALLNPILFASFGFENLHHHQFRQE